jgi:hypothetical protein
MNDFTNNPYRPPQGAVFDTPESDDRIERPRHVFIAVALLWIALVVQAAGLAFIWRLYQVAPTNFLIMAGIITCVWVLMAWIVAMIERGRNWARFTYLVLFLVDAPIALIMLASAIYVSPVYALAMPLQLLLQLVAMILLFIPPAGEWFRNEPAD